MNNNDTPPPGKQCWLGVDGCCFCLHFSTNSTYRFDFELSRLMFPTCRMGHSVNLSLRPCGETEPGCHSRLCPCQFNFCWPVAWHFVIEIFRCGSICPCCSFTSVSQQISQEFFKDTRRKYHTQNKWPFKAEGDRCHDPITLFFPNTGATIILKAHLYVNGVLL